MWPKYFATNWAFLKTKHFRKICYGYFLFQHLVTFGSTKLLCLIEIKAVVEGFKHRTFSIIKYIS